MLMERVDCYLQMVDMPQEHHPHIDITADTVDCFFIFFFSP